MPAGSRVMRYAPALPLVVKPKPGPFWRTASMQMPFRPWPPGLVTVPAMRPCPAVAAAPALASAGRRPSRVRTDAISAAGLDGAVASRPNGALACWTDRCCAAIWPGRLLRELSAGYMVTGPRDCTGASVEPVTTTDCASPRSKTLPYHSGRYFRAEPAQLEYST